MTIVLLFAINLNYEEGFKNDKNKSIIDKISATIILQDFLDKYKKI